jgi:hypothetical protein
LRTGRARADAIIAADGADATTAAADADAITADTDAARDRSRPLTRNAR